MLRMDRYSVGPSAGSALFVLRGSILEAMSFDWPQKHEDDMGYWKFSHQAPMPDGCVGAARYDLEDRKIK